MDNEWKIEVMGRRSWSRKVPISVFTKKPLFLSFSMLIRSIVFGLTLFILIFLLIMFRALFYFLLCMFDNVSLIWSTIIQYAICRGFISFMIIFGKSFYIKPAMEERNKGENRCLLITMKKVKNRNNNLDKK